MGFIQVPDAKCIFTNSTIIVFFYVNDIAVLNRKEDRAEAEEFIKLFCEKYELRRLGEMKWFLNMRIMRDRKARKI